MSSKKEEKGQVAAERIKAAALSAAKGLSRAQAERAAAAAVRNVNAYGQKEEGPSRWQERKEAKRQMYLMSTEKAVKLGERKDLKSSMSSGGAAASQCQKCFQPGHWTYECKNERVYISRPSRSQLLKNPARRQIVVSYEGNPDVAEVVDEEEQRKRGVGEEKKRKNSKRKQRSRKDSGSDTSEASVFESDSASSESESEYSSSGSSTSSYSSTDTEERRSRRRKKQKKQKKRRHHRYSSSSDSESESDSGSDSDSDGRDSRKKSRRRNRRR